MEVFTYCEATILLKPNINRRQACHHYNKALYELWVAEVGEERQAPVSCEAVSRQGAADGVGAS